MRRAAQLATIAAWLLVAAALGILSLGSPEAASWIPAWAMIGAAVAAIGGLVFLQATGRRKAGAPSQSAAGTLVFSVLVVAALAVLALLVYLAGFAPF